MAKNTAEKTKKKIGLSTQIFIALLIGALFGVVIHYWIPSSYIKDTVIVEGVLYVVGQGFIRLMQMLVVPLVFCSLICGSMAIGDTKTLGKVGVKTIGFYLVTTALSVCFSAVVPFFFECSLILPSVALPAVFQDTFFLPPSVFLPIFPAETSPEKLSQHLQSSISISMEYFYIFHHFFPYLSIWHSSENYPAGLVMFSVKICDVAVHR